MGNSTAQKYVKNIEMNAKNGDGETSATEFRMVFAAIVQSCNGGEKVENPLKIARRYLP